MLIKTKYFESNKYEKNPLMIDEVNKLETLSIFQCGITVRKL